MFDWEREMEPVKNPLRPAVRIAPFFVLNDELREERLGQMMRECAGAGFDSVILHPRPGLRTPYLSKSWFEAIADCLRLARAHGLKVWLYDEYPWPSGAAGGRVIQRNADFAEKHLGIRQYRLQGGGTVRQVLGGTPILQAFLAPVTPDGKTRWSHAQVVTDTIGMLNTTWITSDWDSRYYYPQAYVERYACRRSMEYLPEQVFECALPEGRWTLATFTVEVGSDFLEPFGHYVDLSSRDATDAFLAETHDRYRKHFHEDFGSEILGVFTDEPKYRNALPWSRHIEEAWQDYQRDPRALLALLPDSEGDELLRRYRRLTSDLFGRNWVSPVSNWCRKENLELIGHISPEEDWWGESRSAGSILRHLRQFSVPGCDLIIPAVGDGGHPVLNLTPSLAVSAAAQNGASQALCEVFGCSNYSLDLQTVKRVSDWLMLFGINFIVPHGCFYSLAGPRRFDAPPTFLSPSTLLPFLARWSAGVRETAETLGPTRPVDYAIVRPMSHLHGLSDQRADEAARYFDAAIRIARHLLEHGLSFHWVDDEDVCDEAIGEGVLRVGRAAYERLIVWQELLPTRILARLRRKGIVLVSPSDAMELRGPLECASGDLRAVRDTGGRWFCVNLAPESREFRLEGQEGFLEGYESRWFEPGHPPVAPLSRLGLGTRWRILPLNENTFRLGNWTCNGAPWKPGSAYDRLDSGHRTAPTVYGPVPTEARLNEAVTWHFEACFVCESLPERLALTLEEGTVEGDWQVFLNDVPLPDWRPREDFFKGRNHDLGDLVRPGINRLRISLAATDARHGLWLEPVLRGDFLADPDGRLRRREADATGGDWTQAGFPHYSGSMDFEQTVLSGETEGEAWLVFSRPPAGMVEVFLNDRVVGSLLWAPWRIRIQDHLKPGVNMLRLRVTNTLDNFVQGHLRPSGPLEHAEFCIFPRANTRAAFASQTDSRP